VRLKVRHTDGKVEDLTVVRDRILLPASGGSAADAQGNGAPELAYIRISSSRRTPGRLKAALRDVRARARRADLDPQQPGGLVSACNEVASQFMSRNKTIFIEQLLPEQQHRTADGGLATGSDDGAGEPNSASARDRRLAEDNGRAPLIGETTLGKGTVNTFST
jgi:C-terminal processing protease CtpA/Prc